MPRKTPSYRQRKGYDQAMVTLTDARTRKRRDYWLGPHGSPESRELYHQLLAEWEANGRRLSEPSDEPAPHPNRVLVVEVIDGYRKYAQPTAGRDLFEKLMPAIFRRLDSGRLFHLSSPSGGPLRCRGGGSGGWPGRPGPAGPRWRCASAA